MSLSSHASPLSNRCRSKVWYQTDFLWTKERFRPKFITVQSRKHEKETWIKMFQESGFRSTSRSRSHLQSSHARLRCWGPSGSAPNIHPRLSIYTCTVFAVRPRSSAHLSRKLVLSDLVAARCFTTLPTPHMDDKRASGPAVTSCF